MATETVSPAAGVTRPTDTGDMLWLLEAGGLGDRHDLEDEVARRPELAQARLLLELADEARRRIDALCIAIEQAERVAQTITSRCSGDSAAVQADIEFQAAEVEQYALLVLRQHECFRATLLAQREARGIANAAEV